MVSSVEVAAANTILLGLKVTVDNVKDADMEIVFSNFLKIEESN